MLRKLKTMSGDNASAIKILSSFKSTPIEALLRIDEGQGYVVEEPTIQVNHDDTVEHALGLLAFHKISSLPVYHGAKKRHLGFIDRLDFVSFILSKLADVEHPTAQQIDDLSAKACKERVKDVIGISFSYNGTTVAKSSIQTCRDGIRLCSSRAGRR